MDINPIQQTPRRWMVALTLAVAAGGIQTVLLWGYAGAEWVPALTDGVLSVALLCGLAWLSWHIVGVVSMLQTDIVVGALALSFWLASGFVVQYTVEQSTELFYKPFPETFPFRLLFGLLAWAVMMMWYRMQTLRVAKEEMTEEVALKEEALQEVLHQTAAERNKPQTEVAESIDRITVKDGARIHLIEIDELLYMQACGDYVTLFTPTGQYVKEQTMKYFEAHLPAAGFVRVHRSTIVNVTQISRVELFGKENYHLLLKCGVKLKVSNSGYKQLKDRLEL